METDSKLLNRRFSDTDPPATVIAAGTTVRGDLSGGDAVEIRGTLEGDCRVGAHCRVTEGARVRGSVEASGLVVAGEIEAETLTADTIEIRASARVRASLRARVVAIAEGAFYEGDVQMQGPDPSGSPVFFKDRRGPSDAGPSRA